MRKVVIELFVFSILNTANLYSQNELRYISSTTGGACQEVQYYNGYVYAGAGSTLMVFETGDESNPPYTKVFEFWFKSIITDIKIHNNYLYVAANHDGISKWDISNPLKLQKIAEYSPENLTESAYDVEFTGDTVFISNGTKVTALKDNNDRFEQIFEFGNQTGAGIIKGGGIKDSLFIYSVAYDGDKDGIYLYNFRTQILENFIPIERGDPEDVLIGNDTIIHVLGGTQSTTNILNPNGYYYVFDISDIKNPVQVFEDTLKGIFGVAIAGAINAEIINDTVYVASQAAVEPDWKLGDPAEGNLYVYNASDPANVKFIGCINAGLWNFDVTVHSKIYIASEWYGIKTVDISEFDSPIDLGNTLTGGWNKSSDKFNDNLVVANEGFGFKIYDISDISNPKLKGVNNDKGFCEFVSFSNDGSYIYTLYSTGNGFRVFDTNTLTEIGSVQDNFKIKNSIAYHDKIFTLKDKSLSESDIYCIDVSNPSNPVSDYLITVPVVNNMTVENDKLYIATDTKLIVYKIQNNNLEHLFTEDADLFQSYKTLAVYMDTVYTYITNKGLVRYIWDVSGNDSLLSEDKTTTLEYSNPDFLAADNYGLYLGYIKYGIFSFNKNTFETIDYFRTGLGYLNKYGLQDLFCKDGYIFLVDYHAQTIILTNNDNISNLRQTNNLFFNEKIFFYPNPASTLATLYFKSNNISDYNKLFIYNSSGQNVKSYSLIKDNVGIDLTNIQPGIYFYNLLNGQNKIISSGSLVIKTKK